MEKLNQKLKDKITNANYALILTIAYGIAAFLVLIAR
jgi:hypothetical protein